MANVLGFDQNNDTLLNTLVDMTISTLHKSAFVDQAQGDKGLTAARQRYPDVVTMKAIDKQQKQDTQTNQPPASPGLSSNIGNCQGAIVHIYYVKDAPA